MSQRTGRRRTKVAAAEPPEESPLAVVHEAERAFVARVGRARVVADAKVASAHREAERLIAASRDEARWDAERAAQEELTRARREVERVEASAEADAAAIRRSAEQHRDEAAEALVQFILPAAPDAVRNGGPPC